MAHPDSSLCQPRPDAKTLPMQSTPSDPRPDSGSVRARHKPALETDAALLGRWGDGDQSAGDELIRRHFAALHRFLRTKVASDAELEDLVQQTLLGCVEARHRYRGEASFRTFLLAIARHRLFEHYRRARFAPAPLTTTAPDLCTSPTARFVRKEDAARVAMAIARLPSGMRSVLELSYWKELDASAIADRLGVPLNTAYSRLHRAKLALRAALTETSRHSQLTTR
jgi:RNA polymerase sigma factor (sigma-70 family)